MPFDTINTNNAVLLGTVSSPPNYPNYSDSYAEAAYLYALGDHWYAWAAFTGVSGRGSDLYVIRVTEDGSVTEYGAIGSGDVASFRMASDGEFVWLAAERTSGGDSPRSIEIRELDGGAWTLVDTISNALNNNAYPGWTGILAMAASEVEPGVVYTAWSEAQEDSDRFVLKASGPNAPFAGESEPWSGSLSATAYATLQNDGGTPVLFIIRPVNGSAVASDMSTSIEMYQINSDGTVTLLQSFDTVTDSPEPLKTDLAAARAGFGYPTSYVDRGWSPITESQPLELASSIAFHDPTDDTDVYYLIASYVAPETGPNYSHAAMVLRVPVDGSDAFSFCDLQESRATASGTWSIFIGSRLSSVCLLPEPGNIWAPMRGAVIQRLDRSCSGQWGGVTTFGDPPFSVLSRDAAIVGDAIYAGGTLDGTSYGVIKQPICRGCGACGRPPSGTIKFAAGDAEVEATPPTHEYGIPVVVSGGLTL